MPPGCRDFQGPLCVLLPLYVQEIVLVSAVLPHRQFHVGTELLQLACAPQEFYDVRQGLRPVDGHFLYDGGLGGVLNGQYHIEGVPAREHRHRQGALHRFQPPVKRKLPGKEIGFEDFGVLENPLGGDQPHRDRQVERGTLFF